jgi:acetyl-CoA acyltransferase
VLSVPVHVNGVGWHRFGRWPDKSLKAMVAQAVLGAIDDAAVAIRDIDVVFCANAYAGVLTGQESIRGETWMRGLGLDGVPVINVENACASGSTAVHAAIVALASGMYDTALVVGAEKMFVGDTAKTIAALATSADIEVMSNIGLQFSAVDGIRVLQVMEDEGLGTEALEWVTVKNHDNGALNPMAQYRRAVTPEEVRASRMVADPIRLLMCSAISDGAAALVLSRSPGRGAVRFRASVLRTSPWRLGEPEGHEVMPAARLAYDQAGVGPEDLNVAEVHDAVAPAELFHYRDLGFCSSGSVARFVAERQTALGGRLPVNTSGGLNSRGHPVGATGVAQIVELSLQLRGDAGERQVRGARIALAHNAGGWMGADPAVTTIHILEGSA